MAKKKDIDPKKLYRANAVEIIVAISLKTEWNFNQKYEEDDFFLKYDDEKQAITIISEILPEVTLTKENLSYPCDKAIVVEFVDEFLIKYIKAMCVFVGREIPDEASLKVMLDNFRSIRERIKELEKLKINEE